MAEIKFTRDYGYAPAAPFWLVWDQEARISPLQFPDREYAEAEAARLAGQTPGASFHVLACMSTVSTDVQVVGTRFDPSRSLPRDVDAAPDFPTCLPDEEVL